MCGTKVFVLEFDLECLLCLSPTDCRGIVCCYLGWLCMLAVPGDQLSCLHYV